MWMKSCIQQWIESGSIEASGTAVDKGSATCKPGEVVFYQETQKSGTGTLIAQISSQVARAHGLLTEQGWSVHSADTDQFALI